jgi:hypothetical protein
MFKRLVAATFAAAALLTATVGTSLAAGPQVSTWSNDVDVPYVDCGDFWANGVWTVSHRLTVWSDADGAPLRDHEIVEFKGAFVNADTGKSVADSGHSVYFDTLNPDGSFATTIQTTVRKDKYLHTAGRFDFQTETFHGNADTFDEYVALCNALGS